MSDIDQWVEELGVVLAAPDLPRLLRNEPGRDKKWAAGDIARQVPVDQLDAVAEQLPVTAAQLRSYADVARTFPPDQRTVKAAWTVYREVRSVPPEQRQAILRDGLTLRQARLAIGKGPMDQPKRERQSDDDRAWAIIDELQVPRVRELVEEYMRSSSADRKARRAAKTTLDEIAQQRKFIQAEMKKQAAEGSPETQFWAASKELNEAARFVYSIARLHERHPDAMSEERWLEVTKTLRTLSDSAQDVADKIAGLAGGEFIEGEAVEDVLELGPGSTLDDIVDAEVIGED